MTILKWGLIGAGDIAKKRVAPALRDLAICDFTAVSRAHFELAEAFAREFGVSKCYENWQEMLADEEIDAVYIATPVHLHAAQTIAAAQAGKHVLCEKPLAMNVKECDEMIAACRANGVKLGVAYYRHFYPLIERVKEIIKAGEIGSIVLAQINSFEQFNPLPNDPRGWFIEKKLAGGGPMFDFGCHRIEVLQNIFGSISTVKSIVTNVVFDREVEDTATALFQFERKACASLCVTHAAIEQQDTLDIYGTKGSIHISVLNDGELKIKTGKNERVEFHPPAENLHQPLIEDFVEAVLANREPKVNGDIGKAVAEVEEKIFYQTDKN